MWNCAALVLVATSVALAAQTPAGSQQGRWQPPPPPKTWDAQEHHGYMDGVDAAWLDLTDKLAPRPSRHLQYRNPPNVPVSRQGLYRTGFRKGYDAVYAHEKKAKQPEHSSPK